MRSWIMVQLGDGTEGEQIHARGTYFCDYKICKFTVVKAIFYSGKIGKNLIKMVQIGKNK